MIAPGKTEKRLPKGWRWAKLGEVGEAGGGVRDSSWSVASRFDLSKHTAGASILPRESRLWRSLSGRSCMVR